MKKLKQQIKVKILGITLLNYNVYEDDFEEEEGN